MLGAIIGDMVGSIYEFRNHRSKAFPLFDVGCYPTDDSIMTIAVAKAILENDGKPEGLEEQTVRWMQKIGRPYPDCGYGGHFYEWMYASNPHPYNSFGNGSAMRVSACGWAGKTLEEVKALSRAVTIVTHNHPEGVKGAEATACAIFLAHNGHSKEQIRTFIENNYYTLDFTIDEIRPTYEFNETCQHTVPQAIEAFLESASFEDAIRNAISVGGDSDTLAAITGSIAKAYYGITKELREETMKRFRAACAVVYPDAFSTQDPDLLSIITAFEMEYGIPYRTLAAAEEEKANDADQEDYDDSEDFSDLADFSEFVEEDDMLEFVEEDDVSLDED